MQEFLEAWGERVTEARKDKGLTIAALAKKCQVHETTILRIERGTLSPNDLIKWRIAGVLGIRMDRLWAYPSVIPDYEGVVA